MKRLFWKQETRATPAELDNFTWNTIKGSGTIDSDKLKETTYFKCIKYISESVAKCPISIKQDTDKGEIEAKGHKLYSKLKLRPNEFMSTVDAIKAFIAIGEHQGVSGMFIDRQTNSLYPAIITECIIDNAGIIGSSKKNKVLWGISLANETLTALDKDVILFKSGVTFDGINTTSNGELLSQTINTTQKAQNYLSQIFDNGLTNKLVVQLTSDVKDERDLKKIQEKFDRLYSNNGRSFTVPAGYNVSSLNLSLSDAQFEQLRKLTRREIANCFGLSPAIIGDLEDSNNNNMEMQNIGFLVDTLLIKLQQIEQEMDYKLLTEQERKQGFKIRFNQNVLLRTNAEAQAKIINEYVRNGVYTINDARELLGKIKLEGCDEPLLSSGTYKLSQLDDIMAGKIVKTAQKEGE